MKWNFHIKINFNILNWMIYILPPVHPTLQCERLRFSSRVKGYDGWVIAGGDCQLPANDRWLTRGVNGWLVIKNFVFGGNYFARGEFVLI